jgi:type 1 glutamine amidotransferase
MRVLVFSKTTGYRHESIPAGISAFERLAQQSQQPGSPTGSPRPFTVTSTEDASIFTNADLASFGVIVLLQTSGDFLSATQLDSLKGFVRAGRGVVGVHCASTGMPSDPWYGRMIGAVFDNHPQPQRGVMTVEDRNHAIVKNTLGKGKGVWLMNRDDPSSSKVRWEWYDEWYNYVRNPRSVGDNIRVLLSVDDTTYEGGKHADDHPIAWCQEFEGGRTFYTALGHFDEAYADEAFLGQLLNAIAWTSRQID